MNSTPPIQLAQPSGQTSSGGGPLLVPLDIAHPTHLAVVDPDTAFWTLVRKERLSELLTEGAVIREYRQQQEAFAREMQTLRYGLQPTAVYFNPTDLCNLECSYCYIPSPMRRAGEHMSAERLMGALERLKSHFARTMEGSGRRPRLVFHGAEPLLNFKALRTAMTAYMADFEFGVQTNGTLLDDEMVTFLTENGISIGLSLDGPTEEITARTRKSRDGRIPVHQVVVQALEKLRGYEAYSVIATLTRENADHLVELVELLHGLEVPAALLNMTRCTLPSSRVFPMADREAAAPFIAALERSHALYRETGRKLVVGNFANILLAIMAPTARRLMCDISPCGGGRAFFAVAANGDLFPCSEFIGVSAFKGGNLFEPAGVEGALQSEPFRQVTQRDVDRIDPCRRCAIRHFCGAPCPAEAHELNGELNTLGAFCAFYEEQVRYAFRLIADGRAGDFLWDGWDRGEGMTALMEYAGPVRG